MRKNFLDALQDIQSIANHKQLLTTAPISAHESFVQTVGNIILCNRKQGIGELLPLINNYKGSFSNQILVLKYCTYCMQKDKSKTYSIFTILKMLTKWVTILQGLKKKKDIKLYQVIVEGIDQGICTYQQFIVYLNYISNDVIQIIKSGTDQSRKKYSDNTNSPHLDVKDLTRVLNVILPKVLVNMSVPRNFFPPTLLRSTAQSIDILYSNQCYQNIAQNKIHYNSLVRTIIKCLISSDLEPSQQKQLVLSAFKYFYLFHHDKSYGSSQIIIQSFKKMSMAVRFAIMDQIVLFVNAIRKIGKQLFISYLSQKFQWLGQTLKNNKTTIAINKSTLKPFGNQSFGNSLKIKIDAGKTQHYYMQIYERFSLMYFCVKCLQHDITIRFYYLGDFNKQQTIDDKKLLVQSQKKQGVFQGSVQTIQKGIYMFQFDNSYAWMKAKNITFDLSILVPIQIREHQKNKLKQTVFEKHEHLNQVPYQNIIGWVDESQIKLNSTSANICASVQDNLKVYNVKLIKNTGQAYQYQTESKNRFMKKLRAIQQDPNIFWLIDGYKVRGTKQIQSWLEGDFHPETLQISRSDKQNDTENIDMVEENNTYGLKQRQQIMQQKKQQVQRNTLQEQQRVDKKQASASQQPKQQNSVQKIQKEPIQNASPQSQNLTQIQKKEDDSVNDIKNQEKE